MSSSKHVLQRDPTVSLMSTTTRALKVRSSAREDQQMSNSRTCGHKLPAWYVYTPSDQFHVPTSSGEHHSGPDACFWQYKNESRVIFGVMNEPHDIPDLALWAGTVQAAVTAIRTAGATQQMILLPGTDFTGAQTFVSNGSAGNLSRVHNLDGSNTSLIFDVHKYLDSDGSGTHLECVSDHVQDTFTPLARFLIANGRKAILSETGGGNTTSVGDLLSSPCCPSIRGLTLHSVSRTSATNLLSSTRTQKLI